MWDFITDFFSGATDVVGDVATGVVNTVSSFGDFIGSLWGDGAAPGVAAEVGEAATGDAAQATASSLIKDVADTETAAEKIGGLSTDPQEIIAGRGDMADLVNAAPAAKKAKGIIDSFMEWYGDLKPDEKKLFQNVAGAGLSGLGAMGAQAMKGGQREDELRLQAELAGQTAYDRRAGELAATQAANKVPAGVPFRPRPKALLANTMGQPVALRNNPMVPRGIINGRMI